MKIKHLVIALAAACFGSCTQTTETATQTDAATNTETTVTETEISPAQQEQIDSTAAGIEVATAEVDSLVNDL